MAWSARITNISVPVDVTLTRNSFWVRYSRSKSRICGSSSTTKMCG